MSSQMSEDSTKSLPCKEFLALKLTENKELYIFMVKKAGMYWNELAVVLKLPKNMIDDIDSKARIYGTQTKGAIQEVMSNWVALNGNSATTEKFLEALKDIGQVELLHEIEDKFKKKK